MKVKDILRKWSEAQESFAALPCPRCGQTVLLRNKVSGYALSRRADIYICDPCGRKEALEDALREEKITSKELEQELSEWYCAKVERGNNYER